MATFLFDKIIFGPVNSRRLGNSLGINLLPTQCKVCNFNCVYCECGWTMDMDTRLMPTREQVYEALKKRLLSARSSNEKIDVLTYAGNGEPTMHKEFPEIIEDTIELKNTYCPSAKIAVLSNATLVNKPDIFEALNKIDYNILKLDSANQETVKLINQPLGHFDLQLLIDTLEKKNDNLILQTLFLKGEVNNNFFDNSSVEEVKDWLDVINKIRPKQIMIYSIARDTPIKSIEKISQERLREIALEVEKLGIEVSVS